MAKKVGEVDVDFKRDKLSGWQRTYCPVTVDVMKAGIRLGHDFPKVDVVLKNGIYQIRYWTPAHGDDVNKNNGGHHRALAYMFEKMVLRCSLFEEHCEDPPFLLPIWKMKELLILDVSRANDALSYLSKDVRCRTVADLCVRYDLRSDNFLG